jgi:hypothetical protein
MATNSFPIHTVIIGKRRAARFSIVLLFQRRGTRSGTNRATENETAIEEETIIKTTIISKPTIEENAIINNDNKDKTKIVSKTSS